MYAMIRRYRTSSIDEVVQRIKKDFLAVLTSAPGFVAYYVVDESDGVQTSISIFESKEHAEYSNKLAAYWVKEHADFLLDSPDISAGRVMIHETAVKEVIDVETPAKPEGVHEEMNTIFQRE